MTENQNPENEVISMKTSELESHINKKVEERVQKAREADQAQANAGRLGAMSPGTAAFAAGLKMPGK